MNFQDIPLIGNLFEKKKSAKLKHLGISLAETKLFKRPISDKTKLLKHRNRLVKDLVKLQVKNNVPVMTIYLLAKDDYSGVHDQDLLIRSISGLFDELFNWDFIDKNKIKIFVLGKWYDLSGHIVTGIKNVINATKDNDFYFLNFCINYDGQDEIVDAAKIIARKVKFGKLKLDDIDLTELKNNLSTSYFAPPEKILVVSKRLKLLSFLLWDSAYSKIIFLKKDWDEIGQKDLEKFYIS